MDANGIRSTPSLEFRLRPVPFWSPNLIGSVVGTSIGGAVVV